MKILNLYAGIGGNRKLWGNEHEITAVEYKPEIAKIYRDFFPKDNVIIADAHQYLLDHYSEFDFIWSSPPCQTHSRARFWSSKGGMVEPKYPDMKLYEEIIFLQQYFGYKWVVENVISYYQPLLPALEIGRHYLWSNFFITPLEHEKSNINMGTRATWEKQLGLSLADKKVGQRKDQILRNAVEPKLGKHILDCAINSPSLFPIQEVKRTPLFE